MELRLFLVKMVILKHCFWKVKIQMFDKYIKVNEKRVIAGQTSSGVWYCKEVVAETSKELEILIGEVNKILNKANTETGKKDVDKKKL